MFPRLLSYVPSHEQVLTIRICPITFFMGYSQKHIRNQRKHMTLYFESPLGRNKIIIDIWLKHMHKISFDQKIFICNDIISEITNSFQIVVENYII
jgi:hypothetical protein